MEPKGVTAREYHPPNSFRISGSTFQKTAEMEGARFIHIRPGNCLVALETKWSAKS
jgi:hypothetical protein